MRGVQVGPEIMGYLLCVLDGGLAIEESKDMVHPSEKAVRWSMVSILVMGMVISMVIIVRVKILRDMYGLVLEDIYAQ